MKSVPGKTLRIVYMGTPDFAVPALRRLIEEDYRVVAVITAPDKPRGRGQKLQVSPVKRVAQQHSIPVLQPANLKATEFVEELKSYKANLQVVVAFRMLPEVVWSMPAYGTFNLHASLLPQYRGAAPINWAIINGEQKTGLTTFFIRQEIDTGNIIKQVEEPIYREDTAGSLHDRLMIKGAGVVLDTVRVIEKGDYTLTVQEETGGLKKAPKIFREDCVIDWELPADVLHDFVRGLSPYPGARTELNGTAYKILRTSKSDRHVHGPPATVLSDGKTYLAIKAGDGALDVLELQQEGRKAMGVEEFLRGNRI
jgi:methionyl-tRNA formyltransferase